jgi:hypothetical protein
MIPSPAPARTPTRPPNERTLLWVAGWGCGAVPDFVMRNRAWNS